MQTVREPQRLLKIKIPVQFRVKLDGIFVCCVFESVDSRTGYTVGVHLNLKVYLQRGLCRAGYLPGAYHRHKPRTSRTYTGREQRGSKGVYSSEHTPNKGGGDTAADRPQEHLPPRQVEAEQRKRLVEAVKHNAHERGKVFHV